MYKLFSGFYKGNHGQKEEIYTYLKKMYSNMVCTNNFSFEVPPGECVEVMLILKVQIQVSFYMNIAWNWQNVSLAESKKYKGLLLFP